MTSNKQQDRRAQVAFARLELVSHGKTASLNSTGGGADSTKARGGHCPSGEGHPAVDDLRDEYRRCLTDDGRDRIIERAENARDEIAIRPTGPAPKTDVSVQELVLTKGQGYEPQQVANHFGLAVGFVVRIRKRAGRDGDTGELLPDQGAQKRDREQGDMTRALDLIARGYSERDAARFSGVHRTQLRRALGKAA